MSIGHTLIGNFQKSPENTEKYKKNIDYEVDL